MNKIELPLKSVPEIQTTSDEKCQHPVFNSSYVMSHQSEENSLVAIEIMSSVGQIVPQMHLGG